MSLAVSTWELKRTRIQIRFLTTHHLIQLLPFQWSIVPIPIDGMMRTDHYCSLALPVLILLHARLVHKESSASSLRKRMIELPAATIFSHKVSVAYTVGYTVTLHIKVYLEPLPYLLRIRTIHLKIHFRSKLDRRRSC
ncbi:hypothetical protein Mapa_007134 [Marchantia paleacea]|nr:hypothetical protein Mapa_007134 [Marchantia paleacea]